MRQSLFAAVNEFQVKKILKLSLTSQSRSLKARLNVKNDICDVKRVTHKLLPLPISRVIST